MTSSSTSSPTAAPADAAFRWAPWWVLAFVALWPMVGLAEAALSLGAVVALVVLTRRRFQHSTRLLSHEAWALSTVLFFSYWLPEFFSAFDAVDAGRALREAAVDLRYLPFLWLVAIAVATARGRRITFTGIGLIVAFWTLDALVQAGTGFSLGGAATADRLSGIFGADNLKLGLVLASLAPFPLALAARRFGMFGWLVLAVALLVAILLAGARAAWLSYGLVLLFSGWSTLGRKRALLALGIGAVLVAALGVVFSDRLAARFERTEAALAGDSAGIDYALSGRLVIWRAAFGMIADHPVNGVGVRGFREAYPDYAEPDDPFLTEDGRGAYHAHQVLLEVLTETGFLGLLLWLAGAATAIRAWRFASPAARAQARLPGLALAVTVFPLNTHLAFYSTFWGGLTLLLAALYAGALMARDVPEAASAPDTD